MKAFQVFSIRKHLNAEAASELQPSFVSSVTSNRAFVVTRPELVFASFFVEHKIMSC